MSSVSKTLLLCLAIILLAQVTASTGHSFCPCLKTSETVLSKEDIKHYKILKADICHIDAIEFKTVNGLTFCSNPRKLWVKRAMQFVDKKANETTAHPINATSTFKTESVQNTTSHWNGQDELRSRSHEPHEYFLHMFINFATGRNTDFFFFFMLLSVF
uniref:Chemokine interleukin-8-like domain-containing protein n=1 Tax=Cyprinus carpio carpio TaxID=630221 RepID=A0A8C1H654_CYPCA